MESKPRAMFTPCWRYQNIDWVRAKFNFRDVKQVCLRLVSRRFAQRPNILPSAFEHITRRICSPVKQRRIMTYVQLQAR